MIILLGVATIAFGVMWLLVIGAMGLRLRLFLARRPALFLIAHVPMMALTAAIGGAGLLIGVSGVIGGIVGQVFLQAWGKRHGLTLTGG